MKWLNGWTWIKVVDGGNYIPKTFSVSHVIPLLDRQPIPTRDGQSHRPRQDCQ
jgi:hypothetical protein